LHGIRVVDAATVYAGPLIGTLLGDFGADVVKVEHPQGDSLRHWAWTRRGESLWWAFVGRNKRAVTLKLSDPRGAELMRRLLADADIFVENFRPGTLERWGLDPADLTKLNPRLVIVRVTGFGQTGPYRQRPGFGTLAEAMSGFAYTNGEPDGPPLLPQWPLADGVTALVGAYAAMLALRTAERTGQGQIVDLSVYESLFWILGAQTSAHDQLGIVPGRLGNRTPFNVPRNCYLARDGRWLALSGGSPSVARRILHAVGRGDLAGQPWFDTSEGRLDHQDEIEEAIGAWIAGRDSAEVLAVFEQADAAIAPILSIADIVADPHYLSRESVTTVDHPRLGPLRMQGIVPKLSRNPGGIRRPGPRLGEHNHEIFHGELGWSPAALADLARDGVITDAGRSGDGPADAGDPRLPPTALLPPERTPTT
jgi:crotonobetainyl-CoA:carnitine CoA-transferase CaiB-like acyl-CoA transferase